ncbi:FAD binding domain-containing protein [Falsiroseomonas selenitidurans]|uniref:Xanthine dehydrogenase family protein subunit M n=1 Tax=Falsiroseomonas selenitidurans TaxID=2716335 RepID=A0ABX1E2K2_9PROT|nr:FAD binding domain-containing protein [Falsiroseomonas selenitidurans]NKC31394.1 xanthine dehydrogenase family protein subunit M [Falsiroseomonas selenitidurans]
MKPAPFHWHAPTTLAEAAALLAEYAPQDGRVLAGGQSLLPAMALRIARPPHLVDINRVAGLDLLEVVDGVLRIGAVVRHAAFLREAAPGPLGALLAAVARHIAHWPIRQRGTFCGSLCHADPAAEWPLVAAVLDAVMVAHSLRGDRRIAAAAFQRGLLDTALEPDELLRAVELPLLAADARFGFEEVSRRAGDFAQAMALAVLRRGPDGRVTEARLGLGGVEPAPRRFPQAEAMLRGAIPDAALIDAAAHSVAQAAQPMEDEGYRRALTRTVVQRALLQACA